MDTTTVTAWPRITSDAQAVLTGGEFRRWASAQSTDDLWFGIAGLNSRRGVMPLGAATLQELIHAADMFGHSLWVIQDHGRRIDACWIQDPEDLDTLVKDAVLIRV